MTAVSNACWNTVIPGVIYSNILKAICELFNWEEVIVLQRYYASVKHRVSCVFGQQNILNLLFQMEFDNSKRICSMWIRLGQSKQLYKFIFLDGYILYTIYKWIHYHYLKTIQTAVRCLLSQRNQSVIAFHSSTDLLMLETIRHLYRSKAIIHHRLFGIVCFLQGVQRLTCYFSQ